MPSVKHQVGVVGEIIKIKRRTKATLLLFCGGYFAAAIRRDIARCSGSKLSPATRPVCKRAGRDWRITHCSPAKTGAPAGTMERRKPQLGGDIRKCCPAAGRPVGERGKMESVTTKVLLTFFQRLGEQITEPVTIYLLGGSALCLLGSLRETLDVDYSMKKIIR